MREIYTLAVHNYLTEEHHGTVRMDLETKPQRRRTSFRNTLSDWSPRGHNRRLLLVAIAAPWLEEHVCESAFDSQPRPRREGDSDGAKMSPTIVASC